MSGSNYGHLFRISTWGESHGAGVGVVVDGCPAGLELNEDDIQQYLNRRKPGQNKFSTPRKEDDEVVILSGVFAGKTTGTPIAMEVKNKTHQSRDYSHIAELYRPGHADYTFHQKYGIRDYRGGGRSSGRETIGRVAGGAVAAKILAQLGIRLLCYTTSIGPVEMNPKHFDPEQITQNPFFLPDKQAAAEAETFLISCMKDKNSAGGIVECRITGMPTGIGEPVFEKLDANLAKAIMSIGAVKGVEIGDGFAAARSTGKQNNDNFCMQEDEVTKTSNHAGGILGGISDGTDIILRAAVKPTPSISAEQNTVTTANEELKVSIGGRHDPVIAPRAVVVVESMAAITLVDMLMQNMTSKMSYLEGLYK